MASSRVNEEIDRRIDHTDKLSDVDKEILKDAVDATTEEVVSDIAKDLENTQGD